MASEKPNRDPFLTAIEAKIAAWTAVRDSYLAAVSKDGPLGEAGPLLVSTGAGKTTVARSLHGDVGGDLPVGVFRDKSLKEAIPIYLGSKRGKQTNKEIALGLKAGGFPTMADNFEATVATALYRLKQEGVVLRFPDGWDLASSYPDSLRSRLEKDAAPRTKLRAKVRRRKRRPTEKAEEQTPSIKVVNLKRARQIAARVAAEQSDEHKATG